MLRRIFIVIPVHNRRDITLRCLNHLKQNGVFDWASVVVVDDGSTDGTGEEVSRQHPSVHLLVGDGNLWWTGGIVMGMRYTTSQRADYIFWLNDDNLPQKGSLELLLENSMKNDCISVGQSYTPGGYVYSGRKKTFWGYNTIVCPDNKIIPCDFFVGNCVCFPASVVRTIGFPDAENFPHGLGDAEYGLRAKKHGISAYLVGQAKCYNDDNFHHLSKSWLLSDITLKEIWKQFFNLRYILSFQATFRFRMKYWGIFGVPAFLRPYLKFLLICIIRGILPRSLLIKFYGHRSRAFPNENMKQT